jgi:hypothetical protein
MFDKWVFSHNTILSINMHCVKSFAARLVFVLSYKSQMTTMLVFCMAGMSNGKNVGFRMAGIWCGQKVVC